MFSERFLLKCVKSTTANEICSAGLFVIQKKALAKSRSRDILHWMEIRLKGEDLYDVSFFADTVI